MLNKVFKTLAISKEAYEEKRKIYKVCRALFFSLTVITAVCGAMYVSYQYGIHTMGMIYCGWSAPTNLALAYGIPFMIATFVFAVLDVYFYIRTMWVEKMLKTHLNVLEEEIEEAKEDL